MTPDYHSDGFSTARLEDNVSLRSAAREARAALYAVLNRLELNGLDSSSWHIMLFNRWILQHSHKPEPRTNYYKEWRHAVRIHSSL